MNEKKPNKPLYYQPYKNRGEKRDWQLILLDSHGCGYG